MRRRLFIARLDIDPFILLLNTATSVRSPGVCASPGPCLKFSDLTDLLALLPQPTELGCKPLIEKTWGVLRQLRDPWSS